MSVISWVGSTSELISPATLPALLLMLTFMLNAPCGVSMATTHVPMNFDASATAREDCAARLSGATTIAAAAIARTNQERGFMCGSFQKLAGLMILDFG